MLNIFDLRNFTFHLTYDNIKRKKSRAPPSLSEKYIFEKPIKHCTVNLVTFIEEIRNGKFHFSQSKPRN